MRILFLILGIFVLGFNTVQAQENAIYRATFTNLTNGQGMTPPALVVHHSSISIFTLGEEASEGLKLLAKEGDNSVLQTELTAVNGVWNFVSGSEVIFPRGASTEITFWGTPDSLLFVASMLVSTNDGFVAGRRLSLDLQPGEQKTFLLNAYDAGAEENDESCASIPGSPCFSHDAETPTNEGFIYVHPGLTFTGDLGPSLAFASVVAKITITREQ